ncbi:Hsp20/alpha crystallin family protein [Halobiforma nitratireducens]|uniref:Hsp20/alpha crystallin family protein n=1 Tax=Halobiforma nitratireducens TaxID=130048 RepID=UPI00135F12B4|nr:Hsp20/alpha crystallin family protein [Halobiforma nitratireducens]
MPSGQTDSEAEKTYSVVQQDPGWQPGQGNAASGRPSGDPTPRPHSHPAVDLLEGEDDIQVLIDLPGFKEEEISVRTDQNALVVSAERQGEIGEDRQVLLNERTEHVKRSIPLPISVKTNGARASYEDGVCRVELPKASVDHYVEIPFDPE